MTVDSVIVVTTILWALGLCVTLLWREHRAASVRKTIEHFGHIIRSGSFDERLWSDGPTAQLAGHANLLLAHVTTYQRQLQQQNQNFLRLLTGLRQAMVVYDQHISFANESFATLLGLDTTVTVTGRPLTDFVPPPYTELVNAFLQRHLAGENTPNSLEIELTLRNNQIARAELSALRLELQGVPALLLTMVEMGPRTYISPPQLQAVRSPAWETLDSLGEGVLTTDTAGLITYINRAAEQLLGTCSNEALGKSITALTNLIDEIDRHPLGDPILQCLTTQSRVSLGRRGMMLTHGGTIEHYIDLSATPLKNQQGELTGTVVLLRDVGELRGLARQMTYQASHDALTGLVNRREFERRAQEALEGAQTLSAHHMLCYVDLDRFKHVNDTSGHLAGDNMLREVAMLIQEAVRDSDTVGRLGGDEFGVLLISCPLEKARQIANDIIRKVSGFRFTWVDNTFTVGASIGLVSITTHSSSLEELMSAADSACYTAKKRGNHVHFYSDHEDAITRQYTEIPWPQRLKNALKYDHFDLLTQPIVATAYHGADHGPGCEVFIRLQDELSTESVAPADFLRAAERYRVMAEIDCWVVHTALTALANGDIYLPENRSLCINLSGQTLADPSFLEFVVNCLDTTGVLPQQICFEVTENAVISNIEHAKRFIGVLSDLGCHFALDDFGRGLSSLGNLKSLAIDYLKIDGSFIRNLANDTVNQAVVASMVKLARTLNFKIIAEQVEDADALTTARKIGVDFAQGYQLGHPQRLARFNEPLPDERNGTRERAIG